jgi:hypothetical protein
VTTDPSAGTVMAGAAGTVVSTTNVTGALGPDWFAPASVWVATMVCPPSASVVALQVQVVPVTTVVHTTAPASVTTTVASVSPVPEMTGVVSAVVVPSTGSVMTGAAGGVGVDDERDGGARRGRVAGGRRSARRWRCGLPSTNVDDEHDQAPAATVAVQTVAPSTVTVHRRPVLARPGEDGSR